MQELYSIERKGTEAVRKLRKEKLQSGRPFMINSNELAPNQCYLEFPDGNIHLVSLQTGSREFTFIEKLTSSEVKTIRDKFNINECF